MTVEELIEQRTAALAAELVSANSAITAKGGTAATDIHGLTDAIASLPGGSKIIQSRYITIKAKDITVPANDITNTAMVHEFFLAKAAEEGATAYLNAALVEDASTQNQFINAVSRDSFISGGNAFNAYRYRNNAVSSVNYPSANYDAVLVEGTHYTFIWLDENITPT